MESIEKKLIDAIRTRDTLLFLETPEEEESIYLLQRICSTLKINLIKWNPVQRFHDESPRNVPDAMPPMSDINSLTDMLREIGEYSADAVFVLQDITFFLNDRVPPEQQAWFTRSLKQLKHQLRAVNKTIVVLGQHFDFPRELVDEFSIFHHPRPGAAELMTILFDFVARQNVEDRLDKDERVRTMIVEAARGLTADQARRAFAKSLVEYGQLDSKVIGCILDQKKQIIERSGVMEYYDSDFTMESIGGLDNLKSWLRKRKKAFAPEARDLALPEPKGVLVFGVPGGGKSLTAKAVSALWQMPLLRFDIGRIFGRYVGESEQNMSRSLAIAEAIAPCILWIDELEKGFAGAGDGHETTVRVLGSFLTWMQEKKSTVFVIATANNITQLPTEFIRKGRFDELFFVGVPNTKERRQILDIQLRRYKLDPGNFDIGQLTQISKLYTGAEIEQAIIEAKFNAFDQDRKPTTNDIRSVLANTSPIWRSFQHVTENENYKQLIRTAQNASEKEQE